MAAKSNTATTAMSKLSLDPTSKRKAKPADSKPKQPVADSWEDDDSGPSSDDNGDGVSTPENKNAPHNTGFQAPPPTPATPTYSSGAPWQSMTAPDSPESTTKRPEKTDAVARRMIASALGVKAPKLTEEQKAYDRALREKERKRRELEKDEERKRAEEAEKAKSAMWED
ncbi:hypothetical protein BJ170DRAFT_592286 [Xylariales sp. AK1849]|nr:hypothetical protein BJ170DRAFT_592286 [Xylariales sp. AK1849]